MFYAPDWSFPAPENANRCERSFMDSVVSKSVIKEAIFAHHYEEMKQKISEMKKLDTIETEDFTEVQNYFN